VTSSPGSSEPDRAPGEPEPPEIAALRPLRPDGRPDRRGLSAWDRRRLKASYLTAIGGVVFGLVGAVVVGALGASGGAGVAVVLVLAAAGCVLAALVTALLAMVDEWHHRPVGRARSLAALWFFLGAAVLLIMSTGAAAAA
jgi:zinc transporter ZupT